MLMLMMTGRWSGDCDTLVFHATWLMKFEEIDVMLGEVDC